MNSEKIEKNIEIEMVSARFHFLLDIIRDDEIREELKRSASRLDNKQKYRILLARASCEKIVDAVSNALMEQGVSPAGEINKKGLGIEAIIDMFNRPLYFREKQ